MNENHKISSYVFTSIIVAVLGWSIFWVGTTGIKTALINNSHVNFKFSSNSNNIITSSDKENSTIISTSSESISSDTASIFDSIFPEKSSKLSIIITGDVMLDRGVRSMAQKYGYEYLFDAVTPLFKKADITMINLEGPITSNKSKTLLPNGKTTKELTFTFATTTAKILNTIGVSIVNLANNHTTNFGSEGLKETKKWLEDANIKWFGSPWNSSSTESVITKNNIAVAFVGYHAFEPGFDKVINTVKDLSAKGNFVIVTPHWGTEYSTSSSEKMRSQAKLLADSGAGAIIGSHPHVTLDKEWLSDVPVFYSLGNLLFDQYFSPEVMKGNIVELSLKKDSKGVHLDKVQIYETSTASRKGVSLGTTTEEFVK
ncbi:MAG: CapA family protein [Candidatus Paceibacterota bacterium]|jgi:poly-gamma-glutamate synthesis protein (capsule biosynthesis protein)